MTLTCPNPVCGTPIGAQECVGNTIQPTEGSIGVCFACGTPAIYTLTPHGVMLRSPTAAESAVIYARPEMLVILGAFQVADSPWAAAAIARWQLTHYEQG